MNEPTTHAKLLAAIEELYQGGAICTGDQVTIDRLRALRDTALAEAEDLRCELEQERKKAK